MTYTTEQRREYMREYRKRPGNRDKERVRNNKYNNSERGREMRKKWMAEHPDYYRIYRLKKHL